MIESVIVDNFETIISAPSGVKQIRRLVLELAVRGRLVPQDSSAESAGQLLEQLPSARDEMVKARVIARPRIPKQSSLESVSFEIPDSWIWARLCDVGFIVGGSTPRSSESSFWADGDAIPWLTPADMRDQRSRFIRKGARDITEAGLAASSAQLLPAGTVLFSSRAPIGHVGIAAVPLCTNQGFKSCVPYEMRMSEYIYTYLRYAGPGVDAAATGTTFKEVSGKEVSAIPIAVPPLEEQDRIVKKVDLLMDQINELEAMLAERAELSDRIGFSSVATLLGQ